MHRYLATYFHNREKIGEHWFVRPDDDGAIEHIGDVMAEWDEITMSTIDRLGAFGTIAAVAIITAETLTKEPSYDIVPA